MIIPVTWLYPVIFTTWMRQAKTAPSSAADEIFLKHFGKGLDQTTQVGRFWESLWAWKHHGSTGHWEWDECLDLLAQTTGVAETLMPHETSVWPLQEFDLDALAAERLWEKIPLQMPLVSYQRDGIRMTFNLSTGKVDSALQIPIQGVFRRRRLVLNSVDAAALFDSPPQVQGYFDGDHEPPKSCEKRKAEPLGRLCAQCWETKSFDEFSKNQQRQGSEARCFDCMNLSV